MVGGPLHTRTSGHPIVGLYAGAADAAEGGGSSEGTDILEAHGVHDAAAQALAPLLRALLPSLLNACAACA